MRAFLVSGTVAVLIAAPLSAAAAQPVAAHQPQFAAFLGGGVRGAGDLGDAMWVVTGGLRRAVGGNVALLLGLTHSSVGETVCPQEPPGDCRSHPGAKLSGAELGVEFLYGSFRVQPYGVATVGASLLSWRNTDPSSWGFAYSTGLGLSVQAAPRAWLYGEVRWKQDWHDDVTIHGPAGVLGVRMGL